MAKTKIEIWEDVDEHLRQRDTRGEVIADVIIGGALVLLGWGVVEIVKKNQQPKPHQQPGR